MGSQKLGDYLMAMLTFYGDESYGDEDAYSVAGYVATVDQWMELVREWREFAAEEGFTVLHKRLLEHNIPGSEFEWPELSFAEKQAKKKRINQRACGIILRRVIAGFSCSVVKSDWQAFDKGNQAEALGEGFYAAGAINCLRLIAIWQMDFKRHDQLRVVFENGAEGKGELDAYLERNLKYAKQTRGDPEHLFDFEGYSFEEKQDPNSVPLQSADFLAYETYRQMGNRMLGVIKKDKHGNPIPVRGALRCVLQDTPAYEKYAFLPHNRRSTPHYGHYFTKEYLEGMFKFLAEHEGARQVFSVPAADDMPDIEAG